MGWFLWHIWINWNLSSLLIHYLTIKQVYLGKRETVKWTDDSAALEAFERFGKNVEEIEDKIVEKNKEGELKNRVGPVKLPYTLLYPSSDGGLTGRGIPNSTSIWTFYFPCELLIYLYESCIKLIYLLLYYQFTIPSIYYYVKCK